jgi:hypothetical protein
MLGFAYKACGGKFSVCLVKFLLQLYPRCCMIKYESELTPLHHACANNLAAYSMDIIMALLDAAPESTTAARSKVLSLNS